ncbi:MAG: PLP-dependent aminotransferase family protein [Candidatus Gastranaerophilales bacterium]|nr:PLP-dependent aminotransferase family protein [Candidatus Gastranaerophilales bacterium]
MENLLSDRIKSTPPSFIRSILKTAADPEIISFAGGLPNPISFPQEDLLVSMERIVKTYGSKVFQYSITAGLPELRQYIIDRYNKKFGLNLTIDNILITTGSQQALDLIAKVFINKDDNVILEKPSYLGAIQAFSQYRPKFTQVELTENGLNLEQLEQAVQQDVKFMYAIPNFQNPTGLSYSKENRESVFEILNKKDIVLIEDDPYGDLMFEGQRLPYIGAGKLKNSILLGTFSKTVTPGMRTGFIISENTEILRNISIAKEASDLHTNIFTQYLIWDYLMNNDLETHISKITELYKKQAHAMLDAMEKYFPTNVSYTKPKGGMFLWATLPEGVSAMKMFPKALERKVVYVPGDPFYINTKDVNTMRLNYTNADCETIDEGIHRLGDLLKEI